MKKTYLFIISIFLIGLIVSSNKTSNLKIEISGLQNEINSLKQSINTEKEKNLTLETYNNKADLEFELYNKEIKQLSLTKEAISKNPINADLYRSFIEDQLNCTEYELIYEGIMWGSLHNPNLGYYLPILKRILFSKDYVWMEQRDSTTFAHTMNSLESIRAEGKRVEGLIIGFEFKRPITSMIQGFPSDIVELWFELDDDKFIMYPKNINSEWFSFEIMGDELFLERKLMKQLIIAIREKEALETP